MRMYARLSQILDRGEPGGPRKLLYNVTRHPNPGTSRAYSHPSSR
jgi:hypothetical protein